MAQSTGQGKANRCLSTTLRSGRDAKGEGRHGPEHRSRERQTAVSPLPAVEMTKRKGGASGESRC